MSRPLRERLYFEKPLYESVRIIGYAGIPFADFWEQVKKRGLEQKLAQALHIDEDQAKHLLLMAVYDLTRADKRSQTDSRYELNGDARKAARSLLGVPPEDELADFWKHGPAGIVGEPEARRWQDDFRKKQADGHSEEEISLGEPGLSPDAYALRANECNKRQLLCMLRDARKKLGHHGRKSFSGKEAKKEIAAAEAELQTRGMSIPAPGEETAQWDRKKGAKAGERQWQEHVEEERKSGEAKIEGNAAPEEEKEMGREGR